MTPGEFIAAFDVIAEAPGGVERLRALVLRLAVRGRLVPQNSGDEPVGRLITDLAEGKQRLLSEKVITKPRYSCGISVVQKPFETPETWQWLRLGDVSAIVGGGTPRSGEPSFWSDEQDIPWLTPADMRRQSSRYISRGSRDITSEGLNRSSAQMLPAGSVLFSCRAPIGHVGIAANPLSTNQGFKSCVPYVPAMSDYLYIFLKYAGPNIDEQATGTTFKEVPGKEFALVPVPIPPLAEQHRIVAKVDELMGLIDRLETARSSHEAARVAGRDSALAALRNAATSQEVGVAWTCIAERMGDLFTDPADLVPLREAVLQLAVRGRLVEQEPDDEPAGRLLELIVAEKAELVKKKKVRKRKPYGSLMSDEIPFEIPRSWTWARLYDLAHDLGQKVPDKTFSYIDVSAIDNKRGAIISEVPVLDPGAAPSRARKLVRLGSVIYSTVRPYLLNIAVVDCEYSPMPIASTAFAVLHPHSGVHSRLLFFYLRAPFFVDFVTAQMKGVAYPAINDTDLLCAPVPLPPTAEQYRIVAKVDELMGLIDQLEQHLVDKRKYHEASADAATNVV